MGALLAPGSGTFPTFVSVTLIDLLATMTLLVVIAGIAWRLLLWKSLLSASFFRRARSVLGMASLGRVLLSELWNRVLLEKEVFYNTDRNRRFAHLTMFWGFIGLSVTTTLDFFLNRSGDYIPLFGGSLSAIRWLGNVSGAVMMVGATITIVKLIAEPQFRRGRHFGDAWFATLLFLAGATGFITEYFGDQAYLSNPGIPPAAAFSFSLGASPLILIPYGIHLASIGLLLITAPATLFIHALTVPSKQYLDRIGVLVTKRSQAEKLKLMDSANKSKDT